MLQEKNIVIENCIKLKTIYLIKKRKKVIIYKKGKRIRQIIQFEKPY